MIKDYDERFSYFTHEKDIEYLKEAIKVSEGAVEHGNHPFGAILVDDKGEILLRQENIEMTEKDCTGHAETTLMRKASHKFDRDFLWNCTLYTSCEPCCMCCGAIYWGNVGRLVFGATERDLLVETGDNKFNPTMTSDCRDSLGRGQKDIVVVGPVAEVRDEALELHKTYWSEHQ